MKLRCAMTGGGAVALRVWGVSDRGAGLFGDWHKPCACCFLLFFTTGGLVAVFARDTESNTPTQDLTDGHET